MQNRLLEGVGAVSQIQLDCSEGPETAGDRHDILPPYFGIPQGSPPPDPEVFADWHGDFELTDGMAGMLMLDVESCQPPPDPEVAADQKGCMGNGTMMVTETVGDATFRFGFDIFVSSQPPPDPDRTSHPSP